MREGHDTAVRAARTAAAMLQRGEAAADFDWPALLDDFNARVADMQLLRPELKRSADDLRAVMDIRAQQMCLVNVIDDEAFAAVVNDVAERAVPGLGRTSAPP
jgi:hypothetical protein